MNDSLLGSIEQSCRILRLDFSSAEFAALAEEMEFSKETANPVSYLCSQEFSIYWPCRYRKDASGTGAWL